jgi:hypothetical protein
VPDIWFTQQWNAPDPTVDKPGFLAAKETINYLQRTGKISDMISRGTVR